MNYILFHGLQWLFIYFIFQLNFLNSFKKNVEFGILFAFIFPLFIMIILYLYKKTYKFKMRGSFNEKSTFEIIFPIYYILNFII